MSTTNTDNNVTIGDKNNVLNHINVNNKQNMAQNAVQIQNLSFSYSDIFGNLQKPVLNDLTLYVPKGQIYALLGPNGSGKTTLIKCMVNRLKPNAGQIKIFGQSPGSSKSQIPGVGVGYVPQELALFLEFTIAESLLYFGKLYGLSTQLIDSRTDFLLKFLELPEKTKLLADLSDGQRRRISMSIGLIHSPPLLILDEPTVGVDPVLRLDIWRHLKHLSRNCSITIIITTHYIEEARDASTIGFIRHGHMLTEDSPRCLLKKHNTNQLEDIFLKICYSDDNTIKQNKLNNDNNSQTNTNRNNLNNTKFIDNYNNDKQTDEKALAKNEITFFGNNTTGANHEYKPDNVGDGDDGHIQDDWFGRLSTKFALHKHWALFFKNWIKLRGNLTLVFWVLLLPSVELSLFLMVTGPQHGFRVSVFNDESNGNYSSEVLQRLDAGAIEQIQHRTLESAIRSVETGQTSVAITFASNFTDSLVDRLENKFADDSNDTQLYNRTDTVNLYVDMSNIMVGPQIIDKVRKAVTNFLQHWLKSGGENPRVADIPMVYDFVYGRYDPTFAEYALPGLMSFILFYAPLKLCTFAMLKDREEGILERSLVAGVNVADYLISHIVLQFLSLIFQIAVYCFTIYYVWQLDVKGSWLLLIVEIFFHGFCSISFGVLISALVSTESAAMVIRVGVLLPSFFFSGIIWPVESYAPFLQTLTLLSPLTLPTEAFRSIMNRGWGLSHFPVWIAIVSNTIHSVIYLLIAVFTAKIKIINP